MKINIVDLTVDLPLLKGLVVVIDVLRAFTTACFVFNNGAKRIYTVADLGHARSLKRQRNDWILMGERKGVKLSDFDYGNSPSEMQDINLTGRTVIMTTSSGTQAIEKLVHADEIVTGAFVNAESIVKHIKKGSYNEINFLCTDNRWKDNEDFKLASYVIDRLSGLDVEFNKTKDHLIKHPTSDGFLRNPLTENAIKDFYLSMELNKFDFIIRAVKTFDEIYLERLSS